MIDGPSDFDNSETALIIDDKDSNNGNALHNSSDNVVTIIGETALITDSGDTQTMAMVTATAVTASLVLWLWSGSIPHHHSPFDTSDRDPWA